jgi:hypothetical protein
MSSSQTNTDSFLPWVCALMMDVLSNECTKRAMSNDGVDADNDSNKQQQRQQQPPYPPNHPTAIEIKRRKFRWMLYLLRAPVWSNQTTQNIIKIAENMGGGIGGRTVGNLTKWIVKWISSWLGYVKKWHFMLESAI